MTRAPRALRLAALLALPSLPIAAPAQTPPPLGALGGGVAAFERDAPVSFTAEAVEYDRERDRVMASGAVEAWQGGRILRADRFSYDRPSGVAVAEGNVQLLEPDGQVLFAERVALSGEAREAVVEGVRALLAQNGRLAAAGARRSVAGEGGEAILDLSRAVYSPCDLCPEDPSAPPLWQLRSRLATQDGVQRRIRFRDATLDLAGVPVLYTPYLSMPDPSTPRSSGFLTPSLGRTRYLGLFAETPYYWAINESSDATIAPLIATDVPPGLSASYRRRFNAGEVSGEGSVGWLNGRETAGERGWGGHLYSRGRFSLDETWRAGFALNRATSDTYLRAWRQPYARVLESSLFAEGFWGAEGYARVSGLAFQGLRSRDEVGLTPFVLPNALYDHVFAPDPWGGTLGLDATAFSIWRDRGTRTRRAGGRLRYELPRTDALGGLWTLRGQGDLLGYAAERVDRAPNFARNSRYDDAVGNFRVALDWRMPLAREAREFGGGLGRQILEPRLQLVTGPATGRQADRPNEDSLDLEFTDASLFALNRFPGRDRQEGGARLDAALRAAWLFPNGGMIEAMGGRSIRAGEGRVFEPGSGLERRASDWVGRVRVQPTPWLDLTTRTRLDGRTLDSRLVDASASLGLAPLGLGEASLTAGYLQSVARPRIQNPPRPTREVYAGANARITTFWRGGVFGRYDLEVGRPVAIGASLTYEDECLVFDTRLYRSYAEEGNTSQTYPSGTALLFRVGFKTVGDFGLRAL